MRKLLLATCAIGATTVPTLAAPHAVAPAPVFIWTGCYLGGNVGEGSARTDFSDEFFTPGFEGLEPPSSPTVSTSGWVVAGGQVGCNYQFNPNWVVGIEGTADWTNISGSSDPFFGGKAVFNVRKDWIASITPRLGYAVNNWLFYAKGGAAWVGDKYSMQGSFSGVPFDFTGSETRFGWTIGAGIEWAFWQNWSAKVEYAYYDFGTRSLSLTDAGLVGATFGPDPATIKQRVQTVTFGLNYHFWTGARGN